MITGACFKLLVRGTGKGKTNTENKREEEYEFEREEVTCTLEDPSLKCMTDP